MLRSLTDRAGEPVDIDILLLNEFPMMSLAGTLEPLRGANRLTGRSLYRWRLLTADGLPARSSSQLPITPAGVFRGESTADALFVLAAFNVTRWGAAVVARLRRYAASGRPVVGVEGGTWVLAMAGLLAGRRATTHWEDLESFAEAYPDVEVVPDRYVVDGNRITTGGASPALDLMIDLIGAAHGRALALEVASLFIYDPTSLATDPQPIVPLARLSLSRPKLAQAIRLMEERLDEPLSVRAIADQVGITVRGLEYLFGDYFGMSPRTYYQELRLSVGRRLVQQTGRPIAEIALECGFASGSAFARAFRARYETTPRAARRAGA